MQWAILGGRDFGGHLKVHRSCHRGRQDHPPAAEHAHVQRIDSGPSNPVNSALGAGDYPKSFPAWHRIVEENLKASGLTFSIVRPNSFMHNLLAFFAPSIRQQGAFFAAMGDARTSYLDLRDIAAVIARSSPR